MKVGITGHQNLGSEETISWLSDALDRTIRQYKIDLGITSLAIGSDQLFSEILKKKRIQYVAVIPCANYEQTFTDRNKLEKYIDLLQTAATTITLPFDEPSETAFYEAGKRIVNLSDMMIAIWNGLPAKGLGGTGDIVKYADTMKKPIVHLNPMNKTVWEN